MRRSGVQGRVPCGRLGTPGLLDSARALIPSTAMTRDGFAIHRWTECQRSVRLRESPENEHVDKRAVRLDSDRHLTYSFHTYPKYSLMNPATLAHQTRSDGQSQAGEHRA